MSRGHQSEAANDDKPAPVPEPVTGVDPPLLEARVKKLEEFVAKYESRLTAVLGE